MRELFLALGALFGAAFSLVHGPLAAAENEPQVRNIGFRLELFVDTWLIDRLQSAAITLHSPVPREVAIVFDRPWETETTGFVTVLKDRDRYRAYYSKDVHNGTRYTAYAESKDGIAWVKPSLGLVEFAGRRDNNILPIGAAVGNFAAFRDENPNALPNQRYKALGGQPAFAYVSPDGVHWSRISEPVLTQGPFDSQNVAFWDGQRGHYAAYMRTAKNRRRWVRTATSSDFLHWSPDRSIDCGSAPDEDLYTNAVTPYFRAPHFYLGIPMRFLEGRKVDPRHPYSGVSDGVFMSSRDGLHFERFLEGFIRPSLDLEDWTDRGNIPAWGIVPTGPGEISVYWVEHYRHPNLRLRRGTLRTDGFVSVRAPYAGGELLTKPLVFHGNKLVINVATSAAGSVRIALLDAKGAELSGLGVADCPEIYGNFLEHTVAWKRGSDLGHLAGQPVRLRFLLKDADLYSIRFVR